MSHVESPGLTPTREGVGPQLISLDIPEERRRQLLGLVPATPNTGAVAKHTMHFILRNLKSWPRLMALHRMTHLPPMIHRIQLSGDVPIPLANCYTLVTMWADHNKSSAGLVRDTITREIQRLLREVWIIHERFRNTSLHVPMFTNAYALARRQTSVSHV